MSRSPVVAAAVLSLGLFGGSAWADEIRVLQPNGGTFDAGSTLTIKWDYTFMEGMPQTAAAKLMRIELLHFAVTGGTGHGGGTAWTLDRTIADVDVLGTQYSWKIPFVVAGANQVIRITMVNRPALTAKSNPFTIKKALLAMPPGAVQLTSIQVTSPEGGKTYYIGNQVTIAWSKALIQNQATVWLFVCWPDRATCGGGYPVANSPGSPTGSYQWTIAEPEEHDLVIKVQSHDDEHVGYSGVFHVKNKKKILLPKDGLIGPLRKR